MAKSTYPKYCNDTITYMCAAVSKSIICSDTSIPAHISGTASAWYKGSPYSVILPFKEQDYSRSHPQRSASIKDNDIPNQSTARLVAALKEEDKPFFVSFDCRLW
jgi:hypothetical protein